MTNNIYKPIIDTCESRLAIYGDTPAGVGWGPEDADLRYQIMLDLIRQHPQPCSLLDFGCGASHLLDYIKRKNIGGINYHGLDVSPRFIELSRSKYPSIPYYQVDVLEQSAQLPHFDYIVMNGIFTYKGPIGNEEMYDYWQKVIAGIFPHTNSGLAFNVMSQAVDWQQDDLFHVSIDLLLRWLSRNISRHLLVRHDYGLYEYTVYVYREPSIPSWRGLKRLVQEDGHRRPE